MSTPGAAAVISASHVRSSTPVPNCHWAYQSLSFNATWIDTRPARTNCIKPEYIRINQYISGAIAARWSSLAAGVGEPRCSTLARKATACAGASAAVGATRLTAFPRGVCNRIFARWRNPTPPISECTTCGNVPSGTRSMVTIRWPSTCSTHRLNPDSGSHRPWSRWVGIQILIPPAPNTTPSSRPFPDCKQTPCSNLYASSNIDAQFLTLRMRITASSAERNAHE